MVRYPISFYSEQMIFIVVARGALGRTLCSLPPFFHPVGKIDRKPKSWLQRWSERLIKTPSSPAVLSGGKREEKVGVINNVFTAH